MMKSQLTTLTTTPLMKLLTQEGFQARMDQVPVSIGDAYAILDGIRNILALPVKLLLWNRNYSAGTLNPVDQGILKAFLAHHHLQDTFVSINEYNPGLIWERTFSNPRTSLLTKCTLGLLQALSYTIALGRLFSFPGDHYNPFAHVICLYSKDLSIALHEAGHAKDFASKNIFWYFFMGTAIIKILLKPIRPALVVWGLCSQQSFTLYQEGIATHHALQFLKQYGSKKDVQNAYKVLIPAFSTYTGAAIYHFMEEFMLSWIVAKILSIYQFMQKCIAYLPSGLQVDFSGVILTKKLLIYLAAYVLVMQFMVVPAIIAHVGARIWASHIKMPHDACSTSIHQQMEAYIAAQG